MMGYVFFTSLLALSLAANTTQQTPFKIPPGSRVEVEVEIVPPPPGQGPPMMAPQSPMMTSQGPMMTSQGPMMMSPMAMMTPQGPMMMMPQPGMMTSQPPMMTSPMAMLMPGGIQQLLNNMLRFALNLRRMTGNRSPLPMMEEPCPCDVECCAMPMEPRRLIPVLNLPMTMSRACCGCVDCPLSLSSTVSNTLLMAQRISRARASMARAGGETR